MSRLSVIIPHLGNTTLLESTLASVLANRPDDCEVLVILAEPYDDPYDVKHDVQFIVTQKRERPVAAVNLGIRMSRSPVLHVLQPGIEVTEGWADAALRHFVDPRIAAVAPVVLDAADPGRIAAAGMAYHVGGAVVPIRRGSATTCLPSKPKRVLAPHSAAAFYRSASLEAVGGFSESWGSQISGLDTALTFQQLGLWTILEPRSHVVGLGAAVPATGSFRQGMEAERFFWRWAPILGPVRGAASHGLLLAAEAVRCLFSFSAAPRLAGRLTGGCLSLAANGHRRRISELREQSQVEPSVPISNAPHYHARRTSTAKPASGGRAGRMPSAG